VRLGGPLTLALLAVAWGAVAAGMAGVRNETGLLVQRVLLGAVGERAAEQNNTRA
jgi:hypothetical protein